MAIKPAQCRAARGLLDWTRHDLGRIAGVEAPAGSNFERGIRVSHNRTVTVITQALEDAGVVFISGREPGVKLSERPTSWPRTDGGRGDEALSP